MLMPNGCSSTQAVVVDPFFGKMSRKLISKPNALGQSYALLLVYFRSFRHVVKSLDEKKNSILMMQFL